MKYITPILRYSKGPHVEVEPIRSSPFVASRRTKILMKNFAKMWNACYNCKYNVPKSTHENHVEGQLAQLFVHS